MMMELLDQRDPAKPGQASWEVTWLDERRNSEGYQSTQVTGEKLYLGDGGTLVLKDRDGALVTAFGPRGWDSVRKVRG